MSWEANKKTSKAVISTEEQQVACEEGCLWVSETVFQSGERGKDRPGEGRERRLGRLS